jgi:hypothetical protein
VPAKYETPPPVEKVTWPDACTECGRGTFYERRPLLLARIDVARFVCASCWHALGEPWPRYKPAPAAQALHEDAVHRQQAKQGGAERYRVTAGKA